MPLKLKLLNYKKGHLMSLSWLENLLFFKYLNLLYQITYIFKPNVKIVFKLNRWYIYTIENYHALEYVWVSGSDKKCMKDWSLTNNKWILKFPKKKKKSRIIFLQITAVLSKKNIDFIDTPYNNSSETWIYHFVIVLLYKAMARTMNTWRLKKLNSIDFIKT